MTTPPPLILASVSPQRMALLKQLGITPSYIRPADIDETPGKNEHPRELAGRLAREKAEAVSRDHAASEAGACIILAADTVTAVGRRIIGKPASAAEAEHALTLLSGRAHKVFTGICVIDSQGRARTRLVATAVRFKRLSKPEISAYIASGEWRGRAGGCSIQGRGGAFVKSINGSPSAVIGLPLYETMGLLWAAGLAAGA